MNSRCKTCKNNFAIINGIPNDEEVRCKYKICIFEIKEKQRKGHKCTGCKWSTWTDGKYFCILPRCIPNLGSFNGAGKNVKK